MAHLIWLKVYIFNGIFPGCCVSFSLALRLSSSIKGFAPFGPPCSKGTEVISCWCLASSFDFRQQARALWQDKIIPVVMLTPTKIPDELLYKNKIIGITYQNCRRQLRDCEMMLAIRLWYWSLTMTNMVAGRNTENFSTLKKLSAMTVWTRKFVIVNPKLHFCHIIYFFMIFADFWGSFPCSVGRNLLAYSGVLRFHSVLFITSSLSSGSTP